MPASIALTSKAQIRHAVIGVGGYTAQTTTSSGSSTTLVCTGLIGYNEDLIIDRWFLLTSGTYTGQFRRASSFAAATGTVTFTQAFGGTVASGVTFEIYQSVHRPDMITNAVNQAIRKLGNGRTPSIYRVVPSHLIASASRVKGQGGDYYGMPRNMRNVLRIVQQGRLATSDIFNRVDNVASIGNSWTASAGTWGVSSGLGYSVTDTNADAITRADKVQDGVIEVEVNGTTNHDTVYRTLAIRFRMREDYAGTIDPTNCLIVRLLGTAALAFVDLRKNDGGSESSLATAAQVTVNGTYYNIRVEFLGAVIRIWVDDVLLKTHTLTGSDLKYAQFYRYGMRLDKAGSPSTAARLRSFYAFNAQAPQQWHDFSQSYENQTIMMPARNQGRPTGILQVEGCDTLTLLTEDTTAQTLDSDSTAILEIALTDPAAEKLIVTRAELRRLMSADLMPNGDLTPQSEGYLLQAATLDEQAEMLEGMPLPQVTAMRGLG